MSTTAEALVNPVLLRWARQRAHMAVAALAQKVGAREEKVKAWEAGEARPTFKQAQKIAYAAHVPFGYLFLPVPPDDPLLIPDLRTLGNKIPSALSVDFFDVLQDALFKQEWYREHLSMQGAERLGFVGRYSSQTSPDIVARDIAETLKISDDTRRSVSNWEGYLRELIRHAEDAGIWVMCSGTVLGNTHRPLSVDELRGFAISDSLAPLIFINGKDAKAAQIFTLAHELAHLWIGQSGVSNQALDWQKGETVLDTESYCNQVAAEFLLPQERFSENWQPQSSLDSNTTFLARHFRVSLVVVARRAYDLNLIPWEDYFAFYRKETANWKRNTASSGGDYYLSANVRSGERFTRAVLHAALSGRMLLRDAGKLLNISPGNLKSFAKKLNME